MTYQEAEAAKNTMMNYYGYHPVVKQGNINSKNSYYVDYVPNNPMTTQPLRIEAHRAHDNDYLTHRERLGLTDIGTPPQGRSADQHKRIQALNNKSFKRR